MVGSLLYLSRTSRWDIAHTTVLQLTKWTSKPYKAHLTNSVYTYDISKEKPELDIVYIQSRKFQPYRLSIYYADGCFCQRLGKTTQYKSIYIFITICSALVSWSSSSQTITALSTVESETTAISCCCKETMHIRGLLNELQFQGFLAIPTGASKPRQHMFFKKSITRTIIAESFLITPAWIKQDIIAPVRTDVLLADILTESLKNRGNTKGLYPWYSHTALIIGAHCIKLERQHGIKEEEQHGIRPEVQHSSRLETDHSSRLWKDNIIHSSIRLDI